MTGDEFRDLLLTAGLSVRGAARTFEVAPSTIADWQRNGDRIPATVADRLRLMAAAGPTEAGVPDTLGRLLAVLEEIIGEGQLPQSVMQTVDRFPGRAFGQLFRMAHQPQHAAARRAHERELETLMDRLPAFPDTLLPDEAGGVWVGYYQRRAGRPERSEG